MDTTILSAYICNKRVSKYSIKGIKVKGIIDKYTNKVETKALLSQCYFIGQVGRKLSRDIEDFNCITNHPDIIDFCKTFSQQQNTLFFP